MTTPLSFPSDAFPQFPRLSVEAPENWVGLAAVGLPLALARQVEGQAFRPNVLCTINRVGADMGFDAQVSSLNARLKKLPRYKEISRVVAGEDNAREIIVEGRFAGAKGEVLKQFVRIVVLKRTYVYDVVDITGTVSLLAGDNGEDQVREIVRGVEIAID